nr:hypothetical protein SYMBAF_50367 [Serratia symbiotica]
MVLIRKISLLFRLPTKDVWQMLPRAKRLSGIGSKYLLRYLNIRGSWG